MTDSELCMCLFHEEYEFIKACPEVQLLEIRIESWAVEPLLLFPIA